MYLDAVEEAICFGWVDGIQKRFSTDELAQRFTPRKRRSNWTELNKERARRLIQLELMIEAGAATLPDLNAKFIVAEDIMEVLKAKPNIWSRKSSYLLSLHSLILHRSRRTKVHNHVKIFLLLLDLVVTD